MRALEQLLARQAGIDSGELMNRAGVAVFRRARAIWPEARIWRIFCGGGNNGGDGFVVARCAMQAGIEVQLVRIGEPGVATEAQAARAAYGAAGGLVHGLGDISALPRADLVIDAVFGIGLTRAPAGVYAAAIDAINAASAPVLAIDVPSGIDADSGAAPGTCVRASATLALIAWKRGLFTGRAPAHTGRLWLDTLAMPNDSSTGVELIDAKEISHLFAPRARDAHKGHHGHVLVIGGELGMGGAAMLAAEAALRTGAGWVSVATRPLHVPALLARRPELMVHAWDDASVLPALIERADVLVVGPGLGQGPWGSAALQAALASGKPLVLDADALNLIAARGIEVPQGAICTPHPGEASRLLGCSVAEIERDRYAALRLLRDRGGDVFVLKGAGSLVGDARRVAVCRRGNPGMASAGMGDVLSGVIAALRAQGLSSFDAARGGVWLHASAGDVAARGRGERGLIASDLVQCLSGLANP